MTGSIGVFFGKADVSGLLQKIGVNVETYKTNQHADVDSVFRSMTDEERARAGGIVDHIYDTFLERVSTSRHMSKEAVDAVAKGRVWTGEEAFDRHLVDRLGGMREALEMARSLGGCARTRRSWRYLASRSRCSNARSRSWASTFAPRRCSMVSPCR